MFVTLIDAPAPIAQAGLGIGIGEMQLGLRDACLAVVGVGGWHCRHHSVSGGLPNPRIGRNASSPPYAGHRMVSRNRREHPTCRGISGSESWWRQPAS